MIHLTLYTTLGCHLCEALEAWLGRLASDEVTLERVEISDDEALMARYGVRIPVLRDAEGAELERGFEPARLADWLAARGWLDEAAWRQLQQDDADRPTARGAQMRGGRRYLG
ncbi:glutaredoxin family protein [Halomonas nitroreducens]|uniref:Glutaredoxin family protein n=1 Tax=Halomonas nitroreducens TaxID=447425 RepID=A0A3S0J7G6_9GAMM|nr:glutaredoxin family protein [Halomonas nitroreducens]RTQ99401.1 glutaredoxin family protein [Halomonas nitroreducens]